MTKPTSESYLIVGALASFLLSPLAAQFVGDFFADLACRSNREQFLCGFPEGTMAYIATFSFFIILGVILLAVAMSLRVKRKTLSADIKK